MFESGYKGAHFCGLAGQLLLGLLVLVQTWAPSLAMLLSVET